MPIMPDSGFYETCVMVFDYDSKSEELASLPGKEPKEMILSN